MAAKKLKPLKWISTIPKESQFLWLVGLLECTGSFMCGRPSQPRTPRIEVAGSDPVTLTTLACLLDINVENSSRGSSTTLGGKRAIAIMLRLHAFLGPKRQDQITGVVTAYARVLGVEVEDLDDIVSSTLCREQYCLRSATDDTPWCDRHGVAMAVV
jgi:hypothetical protein